MKNKKYYRGQIWPGKPYPLGATYDGRGVNFSIYSENAEQVTLCLFQHSNDQEEYAKIPIQEVTDHIWHVYLPDIQPGQFYNYRVEGSYDPEQGYRFNSAKLLIDPYAKAICGATEIQDPMYDYEMHYQDNKEKMVSNNQDSAGAISKCIVIDPEFDWEGDQHPQTEMHDTIIYELHVKGFTAQHPEVPEHLRGTYKGLASDPVVNYFKKLGVTAIELMPVHHFAHRKNLLEKGLRNYWGYDSIGYFAPHAEYSSTPKCGGQVQEFKEMVKTYHQAGIEVILDVVYNHTAEGDHLGPSLAFRGVDNTSYYRLNENNPKIYTDYTGTGNTFNLLNTHTLQLVMDSLRYWILEMHVDGFRFDLASALARGLYEIGKLSTFLDTIHQDPVISQVKLIAEPWDIGEGGYQVGNFPVLWAEWNGKYRDSVRKFWRGDDSQVAELAYRMSGSSDLYQDDGRKPYSSINFITAHDGFTLHDLVSYNNKHNEANGENNQDGDDHNHSYNYGVEGPTDNSDIQALREKQKRNFLATLILSQGVPMISHGDECGRSQNGNNNPYCQDNEITWMNWSWSTRQKQLFDFTRKLIEIRKNQPVTHRRKFFKGRAIKGKNIWDIRWLREDGDDMTDEEWNKGYIRCMGMLLNGKLMEEVDAQGKHITDDILLLIVNSYWEPLQFKLPGLNLEENWELLLDTSQPQIHNQEVLKSKININERSLLLLRKQ